MSRGAITATGLARLAAGIDQVVVVRPPVIRFVLAGLLCEGHILLQDAPGTGKTLLARTLARLVAGDFARVQCTPDLLPSDITGSSIYDQATGAFRFMPGPIFANIVLIDEINRATPRTQSSLFEAMVERQVTADGLTHALPRPFAIVATQNRAESAGTYALPEGELDRFLFALQLGYPTREQEQLILERGMAADPLAAVMPVIEPQEVLRHAERVRAVHVSAAVRSYIVELIARTRQRPGVLVGVSPRGAVALQHASQALAYLDEQEYVSPDHVQEAAGAVLAHRLVMVDGRPEAAMAMLAALLDEVPVPFGGR